MAIPIQQYDKKQFNIAIIILYIDSCISLGFYTILQFIWLQLIVIENLLFHNILISVLLYLLTKNDILKTFKNLIYPLILIHRKTHLNICVYKISFA